MMTLSEVIDAMNPLRGYPKSNKNSRHSVYSGDSRVIIRYINKKNTPLLAYGYSIGQAIVIFRKHGGLIAYVGCIPYLFKSRSFSENYSWYQIDVKDALDKINKVSWIQSDYTPNIEYKETKIHWPLVYSGEVKIQWVRGMRIKDIQLTDESISKYKIFRLKSGRLRIEFFFSYKPIKPERFLKWINFYTKHKYSDLKYVSELPTYNHGKIFDIERPSDAIMNELIIQATKDKIKESK